MQPQYECSTVSFAIFRVLHATAYAFAAIGNALAINGVPKMANVLITALAFAAVGSSLTKNGVPKLWNVLEDPAAAFCKVFGKMGERGEYMDGYSKDAMIERCIEDYGWKDASGRVDMMVHLYHSKELWKYTSMVAFAEHYIVEEENRKPFDTFQVQKQIQAEGEELIFSGVVFREWEDSTEKLVVFKEQEIDYVRLECNLQDVTTPSRLADDPRLIRLAQVSKECQELEMVPLILLQVPWREAGDISKDSFSYVVKGLRRAFGNANVESKRVMLETRPPIGVSAQEEKELGEKARIALGFETGAFMFQDLEDGFGADKIAGFCVAGGSTKGQFPTAMEDDTQNAVRQGMRHQAKKQWGYDLCFWEMGAKLMLQPKVGQLWRQKKYDASRELFCKNAQALAEEIRATIPE